MSRLPLLGVPFLAARTSAGRKGVVVLLQKARCAETDRHAGRHTSGVSRESCELRVAPRPSSSQRDTPAASETYNTNNSRPRRHSSTRCAPRGSVTAADGVQRPISAGFRVRQHVSPRSGAVDRLMRSAVRTRRTSAAALQHAAGGSRVPFVVTPHSDSPVLVRTQPVASPRGSPSLPHLQPFRLLRNGVRLRSCLAMCAVE